MKTHKLGGMRRPSFRRASLSLEVLERRWLLSGNVTAAVVGGNLVINGDGHDNDIVIDQSKLGDGQFRISSGADATNINGVAGPLVFTGVSGDLRMTMNGGNDSVELDAVEVYGSVLFDGGSGDNSLFINEHLARLNDESESSVIARDVIVKNGSGYDTFEMSDSDVGRNVTIDNGGGGSETNFFDSFIARNLTVTNKNGSDDFLLLDSVVTGSVSIDNGNGQGKAAIPASVEQGGGEASDTDFVDSFVAGNVSVRNKDGFDKFKLKDSEVDGDVSIDNGSGGSETKVKDDSSVAGDLFLLNKAGYDEFKIEASNISGNVTINNGNGDSDTYIGGEEGDVQIGGDLSVVNKAGYDGFDMYDSDVAGNVSIDHGNGGSSTEIDPTTFWGDLAITTGSGQDELDLSDLMVYGDTTISTGNDCDHIAIYDAWFAGTVLVDAGSGNDEVDLDVGAKEVTTFQNALTVLMGAGNDNLYVGDKSDGEIVANSTAVFNGGSGSGDSIDYVGHGNVFAFGPVVTGFESAT